MVWSRADECEDGRLTGLQPQEPGELAFHTHALFSRLATWRCVAGPVPVQQKLRTMIAGDCEGNPVRDQMLTRWCWLAAYVLLLMFLSFQSLVLPTRVGGSENKLLTQAETSSSASADPSQLCDHGHHP